ncbi:hypothetical protein GOB94_14710 [Granulicella sp. 5B5]|nr:hypothetical protein GOB94_14710 [Granulicella sp. 5B5]
MVLSTHLEAADLKEAERLARYSYYRVLRLLQEKDLWLIAAAAAVLTVTNLLKRTHVLWGEVVLLYLIALFLYGVRHLWVGYRLRAKAEKMNSEPLSVELTSAGVRFLRAGAPPRIAPWETYLDARAGERVLLLYFQPKNAGSYARRKYFIIPLLQLRPDERIELLLQVPEKIRGESVQRVLSTWRSG